MRPASPPVEGGAQVFPARAALCPRLTPRRGGAVGGATRGRSWSGGFGAVLDGVEQPAGDEDVASGSDDQSLISGAL